MGACFADFCTPPPNIFRTERMQSTKNEERADTQTANPTGRDGAVDYAARKEALGLDPESDLPHHVYRVID
jgi:hypothetical protein